MALRCYFAPRAGTGTVLDGFRPKYVKELGLRASWMDYGLEDVYLVAADVTPEQHSTLSANADVVSIPQNLDAQVGANLAAVQAELEALNFPAAWITATHTYRQILRVICKCIQLMQRYRGVRKARFFLAGITLTTLISELSAGVRNGLSDAATSLGLDVSGVTGSMTIRQAWKQIADQLPTPSLAGVTF